MDPTKTQGVAAGLPHYRNDVRYSRLWGLSILPQITRKRETSLAVTRKDPVGSGDKHKTSFEISNLDVSTPVLAHIRTTTNPVSYLPRMAYGWRHILKEGAILQRHNLKPLLHPIASPQRRHQAERNTNLERES